SLLHLLPPPIPPLFPYTTLFRSCAVFMSRQASEGAVRMTSGFQRFFVTRITRVPRLVRSIASAMTSTFRRLSRASCIVEFRIRRSEEHTSELQSRGHLVCRLLLE